jgi:hypothetical protein
MFLFCRIVHAHGVWRNIRNSSTQTPPLRGLFVSGISRDKVSKLNTPALWHDNKFNVVPTNKRNSSLSSFEVVGSDVYRTGTTTFNNKIVATIWKNEKATFLTDTTVSSVCTSVVVHNNIVYATGATNLTESPVPVLWINGVPNTLEISTKSGYASKVKIKNNKPFVVGVEYGSSFDARKPVFWYEGKFNVLPTKTSYEVALDILVEGEDVYISGNGTINNNLLSALYWKNGVRNELTAGSNKYNHAISISIDHGDVYMLGRTASDGTVSDAKFLYWKNGSPNYFFDPKGASMDLRTIQAIDGDVYIGGNILQKGVDGNFAWKATYWVNGSVNYLEAPEGTETFVLNSVKFIK